MTALLTQRGRAASWEILNFELLKSQYLKREFTRSYVAIKSCQENKKLQICIAGCSKVTGDK